MTQGTGQRVALVTGGAVRLGRSITLGLAREGYDVVVAYGSSGDDAADVAAAVEALGQRCETVQADLRRPEAAETLRDEAIARVRLG